MTSSFENDTGGKASKVFSNRVMYEWLDSDAARSSYLI